MKLESDTCIYPVNHENELDINDSENLILNIIEQEKGISLNKLNNLSGRKDITPIIKSLSEKGYIALEQEITEKYKPKLKSFVRINPVPKNEQAWHELFNLLEKWPKQLNMLMVYLEMSKTFKEVQILEVGKSELIQKSGSTIAVLNTLVSKGIFELYEKKQAKVKKLNHR
ncbi:MAG: hypothetical protein HC906_08390 [Bacteroidales bacterium]|nr:hypothetical protein [Bacteroidales bacterium]